jgi:DNA-binding MarR family transcriptional regulator
MKQIADVADAFLALIDKMHGSGIQMVPARIAEASPGAFRIMHYVHEYPGTGVQDIAKNTGLAKPTVSLLVKDLIARGIFQREPLKNDRRRAFLYLTDDGGRVYFRVKEYRTAKVSQFLSVLEEEELSTMGNLMEKILDQWRNL